MYYFVNGIEYPTPKTNNPNPMLNEKKKDQAKVIKMQNDERCGKVHDGLSGVERVLNKVAKVVPWLLQLLKSIKG